MCTNIYFNLEEDVKVAFFKEHAIVLNLNTDEFTLIDEEYSVLLRSILTEPFNKFNLMYIPENINYSKENIQNLNKALQDLRFIKIISAKDFSAPNYEMQFSDDGMANMEWRLPQHKNCRISLLMFLKIYYQLFITHFVLKFSGIKALVCMSNRKVRTNPTEAAHSLQTVEMIACFLNKTCAYFPIKTKCLEWAATLQRLASRRGMHCQLVIGVQTFPFMSHAWVEYKNSVILDNVNLSKELAVIIRVPNIGNI